MRAPTDAGDVWFKEDPPPLAFEPALTELLERRRPDRLPETVAVEGPRLLTRDAGRQLRAHLDDGGTAPPWEELGGVLSISVVHTEAHDGNLFVRDGHVRLLDWAEAVVSHPFVGAVLPLRFAVERTGGSAEALRDAYLEPFTRFAPMAELRQAFAHGYLLGTLVRADVGRARGATGRHGRARRSCRCVARDLRRRRGWRD